VKIGSLIGSEDEPLVPYQRSANGAAVAVIVVGRFSRKCAGRDGLRSQVIQRIQIAILELLFTGSMPVIGSSLRHQIELASGGVAGVGAELVGLQGKFSHCIGNNS
jgi:hypothetical protein